MKKYSFPVTKKGWEENTEQYATLWDSCFKQWLSDQEEGYIASSFRKYISQKKNNPQQIIVLDIGFGAGRILKIFIKTLRVKPVYGIDYAQSMVDYIKKLYKSAVHVQQGDITTSVPKFGKKFRFITSIRVLKYSPNWRKSIANVSKILDDDGYFLFSLPNRNSLTYFSSDKWPKVSVSEVRKALEKHGLILVETNGFMRLPEFFYQISGLARLYIVTESVLHVIFPKHLFSREIFFLAKKK